MVNIKSDFAMIVVQSVYLKGFLSRLVLNLNGRWNYSK